MKRVTISFDNGPSPGHTERVLERLAKHDIKSSFFVVGDEAVKPGARALMEQTKAAGHWIANHTLTHGDPLGSSEDAERAATEIGDMQTLLGDLAHTDRFFRPNAGGNIGKHLLSRAAVAYLAEGGYTVVTWNNVPGDWIEPKQEWVERAFATMEQQPWSLLVIHDFLVAPMIDTLDRFITGAKARGYEIVQQFPPDCLPMVRGRATPLLTEVSNV